MPVLTASRLAGIGASWRRWHLIDRFHAKSGRLRDCVQRQAMHLSKQECHGGNICSKQRLRWCDRRWCRPLEFRLNKPSSRMCEVVTIELTCEIGSLLFTWKHLAHLIQWHYKYTSTLYMLKSSQACIAKNYIPNSISAWLKRSSPHCSQEPSRSRRTITWRWLKAFIVTRQMCAWNPLFTATRQNAPHVLPILASFMCSGIDCPCLESVSLVPITNSPKSSE